MRRFIKIERLFLAIALILSALVLFKFVERGSSASQRERSPGCDVASMTGLSYWSTLDNGAGFTISAEKMSVRDRQFEGAVFGLFKEVVISKPVITVIKGKSDEILDWATFENLIPLAMLIIPGSFQQNKLYVAGTKIVLEEAEISLGAGIDSGREAWLRADMLDIDALSDVVVFPGRLEVKLNSSESISCESGGTWNRLEKTFSFPRGYYRDGRYVSSGSYRLANNSGASRTSFVSAGHFNSKMSLLKQNSHLPGKKVKLSNFMRQFDREQLMTFFWQYLALNGDRLHYQRSLSMQLLMPGFQLGAFDPGSIFTPD